ncbi:unnamed protein product [Cylindrotheca closterium]|uniref:Uncharacterized protein n=1 Tax=Cylindrotheca closterium TaxID=2856 RepID=A0AAD2FSK6_9STRA|nr:unnamed protein product [Cylindrotheca closterium]
MKLLRIIVSISLYHCTLSILSNAFHFSQACFVQAFVCNSPINKQHHPSSQVRNFFGILANSNNANENSGYDIEAASVKLVWEKLQESSSRPVLDLSSRDASPDDSATTGTATSSDDASNEEWASGKQWQATKEALIELGISIDDETIFLKQCPQLLRLDTGMILETAEWIIQEFGGADYFAKQPSSPKLLSYCLVDVQYGIEFMSTMMMNDAKPFCKGSSDFFQTAINGGIQERSISNALGAAGSATYQANQKVAGDTMSSLQSLKNRKTKGL